MQGDAAAAVHTALHWIKMDTTACHVTAAAAGVTDDGHCDTLCVCHKVCMTLPQLTHS